MSFEILRVWHFSAQLPSIRKRYFCTTIQWESFLITKALHAAISEDGSLNESTHDGIISAVQVRMPLFAVRNQHSHADGGFTSSIQVSEVEKIKRWKNSSWDYLFPWVAITGRG